MDFCEDGEGGGEASVAYGEPGIGASGWPRGYESGPPLVFELERRCSLLVVDFLDNCCFLLEEGLVVLDCDAFTEKLRVVDCERRD